MVWSTPGRLVFNYKHESWLQSRAFCQKSEASDSTEVKLKPELSPNPHSGNDLSAFAKADLATSDRLWHLSPGLHCRVNNTLLCVLKKKGERKRFESACQWQSYSDSEGTKATRGNTTQHKGVLCVKSSQNQTIMKATLWTVTNLYLSIYLSISLCIYRYIHIHIDIDRWAARWRSG